MDVYLKLPGFAGSSARTGYRHWMTVQSVHFERPLLEKDEAAFTIFKMPDALSRVLQSMMTAGTALPQVQVHHVEGHEALGRLRFDEVRVSACSIDGSADLAMECVQFRAARWQPE